MKYTICVDEIVKIRHLVEVETEQDSDIETVLDMLDAEQHESFDDALHDMTHNYEDMIKVTDFTRNYSENISEIEYDFYDESNDDNNDEDSEDDD